MISLVSDRMPSIAAQFTAFTGWPCIWNTCSSRFTWFCVSCKCCWKALFSSGLDVFSIIVGRFFVIWFSA